MWARFAGEGVQGIIRGDEGFGTRNRPEAHHGPAQGLVLLSDFLDPDTAAALSGGRQALPGELLRQPGESVQTYGDRLIHAHFIPVTLASLSDVKAPFLEIANPLLSRPVLEFVRQMPDALRVRRALYERLVTSLSPPVPFARISADDNWNGFLYSGPYRRWMEEELQGGLAGRVLPEAFQRTLLAALGESGQSLVQERSKRILLKRLIPRSWVAFARSLRRPDPPETRLLAFRFALASRMEGILRRDAEVLAGVLDEIPPETAPAPAGHGHRAPAAYPPKPAISPIVIGTTP
jgi:hypothetical protein